MPRGRPPRTLDDKALERIREMRACGVSVEDCAAIEKIALATLYKLARPELEAGKAEGIKIATGQLMKSIKQGNVASIIFFLKTQAGWREVQRIESVAEVTHKGIIKEEPLDEREWDRIFSETDGSVGTPTGTPARSH